MENPENLGENVWYFPYSGDSATKHLTKALPKFKKEHPELIITAIVPDLPRFHPAASRILCDGWVVNCEPRNK